MEVLVDTSVWIDYFQKRYISIYYGQIATLCCWLHQSGLPG